MQLSIDVIPLLTSLLLLDPQTLEIRCETTLDQLLTQLITERDQVLQVESLQSLKALELRQSILNPIQMLRITLERQSVLIQATKQILHTGFQLSLIHI